MHSATGECAITSWKEHTYRPLEGAAKLTRASVEQEFTGDLVGAGAVEWLLCYLPDGSARFVGLLRVEGVLAGHRGSFVVDCFGDVTDGDAKGSWAVVVGSGTGELAEMRGHGNFSAPRDGTPAWSLEYTLE